MNEKNNLENDLDPEVIKVRDKIITKIGDKPLEEVNSIIKKLLNEQMDEVTRIGALAARLKIIRSKIDLLYERKVKINKEPVVKPTNEKKEDKVSSEEQWVRVKMLEIGDVNGKQIDKGVVLDVKEEDAQKLIDAKKAIRDTETPKSEEKTDVKEDKKVDSKTEEKIDSKTEQKSESEKEEKIESKIEPKPESKKEEKVESKTEDKFEKNEDPEVVQKNKDVEKKETSSEENSSVEKKEESKEEIKKEENLEKKDLLELHKEKEDQKDSNELDKNIDEQKSESSDEANTSDQNVAHNPEKDKEVSLKENKEDSPDDKSVLKDEKDVGEEK